MNKTKEHELHMDTQVFERNCDLCHALEADLEARQDSWNDQENIMPEYNADDEYNLRENQSQNDN